MWVADRQGFVNLDYIADQLKIDLKSVNSMVEALSKKGFLSKEGSTFYITESGKKAFEELWDSMEREDAERILKDLYYHKNDYFINSIKSELSKINEEEKTGTSNFSIGNFGNGREEDEKTGTSETGTSHFGKHEKRVLEYLSSHSEITLKDAIQLLSLNKMKAYDVLSRLVKRGYLLKTKRGTYITLKKQHQE